MALRRIYTDQASLEQGCKVCVYSQSGAGKTKLISTAPNPVVISVEKGLLSLRKHHIFGLEVHSLEDVYEAYRWVTGSTEARNYWTVCLDSISEVAEVVLADLLGRNKDGRKAYGEMIQEMAPLIRAFRDINGKHVYMSAKMEAIRDEVNNKLLYGPLMPGTKLGPQLPYFFDEVFCLRLHPTKDAAGNNYRYLQTQPDFQYDAKDRSGSLAPMEPPDLTHVFNKMIGG